MTYPTVDLLFLNYNNYFNKILRKPKNPFSDFYVYTPFIKTKIFNVAFNENDGVTAYQVVNQDIDEVGNYLIVTRTTGDRKVYSHWFVTEAKRNLRGQCIVTLQRDLLVDYYEKIKDAPAFIERGILDNDDPMIFNDENMRYNQIKQSEVLLKDRTETGWIVGYISKNAFSENTDITANTTINSSSQVDYEYDSWSDAPQALQDLITGSEELLQVDVNSLQLRLNNIGYIPYESTYAYKIKSLIAKYAYDYSIEYGDGVEMKNNGNIIGTKSSFQSLNVTTARYAITDRKVFETATLGLTTALDQKTSLIASTLDLNNSTYAEAIQQYQRKIVKVGGTIYKIKKLVSNTPLDINLNDYSDLKSSIVSVMNDYIKVFAPEQLNKYNSIFVDSSKNVISTFANAELSVYASTINRVSLKAEETGLQVKVNIPVNRQRTIGEAFDMFAIPLSGKYTHGPATLPPYLRNKQISTEASIAIAQEIATQLGGTSNFIYDLQLLPYCPMENEVMHQEVTGAGMKTYFGLPSSKLQYSLIKYVGSEKECSFILFCDKASFTSQIAYSIPKSSESKFQKTLDKYRLSSPNYASMFDFTPDMNGGVSWFNIYCDYKPYRPFIKINPQFSYLYGDEFKDPQGLILSGDFSLAVLTEAWTNYMIQNKNFEAMFDRGIQSTELANNVQYQSSLFGAAAGTVGGTVAGAIAGSKLGVAGAVGGAVVGGVASGVGGAIDVYNQDMLRNDQVALQTQMHAFQVENIKALPYTIQKISAFTQINKVFPVLEYFTCTQKERNAFADYITYNGMTVGRIDTIANFEKRGGFIQGRFIRIDGLDDDYHVSQALNTTFQAGFYFEEEE